MTLKLQSEITVHVDADGESRRRYSFEYFSNESKLGVVYLLNEDLRRMKLLHL